MNFLFQKIESQLNLLLYENNFVLLENRMDENAFGSIYSIWINNLEKIAIRLVYDGKEGLFIVEESPFMVGKVPNSWSKSAILSANHLEKGNYESIIDSFINEIKIF